MHFLIKSLFMKKNLLSYLLALCAICLFTIQSEAQSMVTKQPRASQKAWVGQTVGLTNMKVVYHRPAVKDRQVWGKLVPYDQVWRAGANENTIVYFSDDVKVEGQPLPAGKYGLHLIPSENEATVIFSKEHNAWGSYSYNPDDDALRVSIKPVKADRHYEMLTFQFDNVTPNTATCELAWGDKKFPFTIEADVHEVVLASLREELKTQSGWSWNGWNEAANYCAKNNINHEEAMKWAGRSVAMNPNPQNMMTAARLKAQVKAGDDEAKQTKVMIGALDNMLDKHAVSWREYEAAAKFASKKGMNDKAMAWAKKSVSMSPNMTNMMTKAHVVEYAGHKEKAEKIRAEAIAKGSNAELNNYGYQLLGKGKTDKAVMVFEANVKKHPEDPNVWDSLGEGYMMNGQKDKAIESFRKSLSMNPPDNVRANSIKCLNKLGVDYAGTGTRP